MSDDQLSTAKGEAGGLLAPVLPLRDIVVFPHMIVPLFVGAREIRPCTRRSDERGKSRFLPLTQKNASDDDPSADGLHTIGTMATVLQLLKLPDQTVRVLVEGKHARPRHRICSAHEDFFQATIERIADKGGEAKRPKR